MMISFSVSQYEADVIEKIAHRAQGMDREYNGKRSRSFMDWVMDIRAAHASGNPLRLDGLLDADDFNFIHDAFGIARHLDRSTGKLLNCFSPRYSQPKKEAA